ncbi:glyoxalase domain-containing protein 4-like isoform X2 [Pollicipes pollicipes]|nr:glyoxalase domain-containing protein 4-like isoform X2 [Pollicipes pollicipes]XP_037072507.1 glyoxalase domain-containing protein 4-like isoform X2 [Pollicipes pollicipes]XP_037072508.1 glyoxalase domain-containing protein 4-like isoform X2 [Pollicipes pollicipes]XP_037072509.1 glyoxalase domain-containing protein 4-like isoform X2 [Pollicipes pollicipes]XP_037072510.1 glyoxalase domain-containing protein 4-like isoform X2 [Pollicipes pollicipes]XP_037072511.1 glyoxalase domain-containing p
MATRRALHYVFKVGDRTATAKFYKEILGMQILRHEEFEEGCKATCNGPYDGKWSKTMVGYGPEDSHFVVELTYNYGLSGYRRGNDFLGLTIHSRQAVANARRLGWPMREEGDLFVLEAPGGYPFRLRDEDVPAGDDPVRRWGLACSDLARSVAYWGGIIGMTVAERAASRALLGFGGRQASLELVQLSEPIERAAAFGRSAFACPTAELAPAEARARAEGGTVLTPLVTLETPGKADVSVVILADPDDHEICLVGAEGFAELSQVDPAADDLLQKAIDADKSDQWFAKKGGKKTED